jgi:hypothetical protein
MKEAEYQKIQLMAYSRRVSVADWVRQSLGLVRRLETSAEVTKKLEVIRAAAQYSYPVPSDIY